MLFRRRTIRLVGGVAHLIASQDISFAYWPMFTPTKLITKKALKSARSVTYPKNKTSHQP
jgi:hypothetical protein